MRNDMIRLERLYKLPDSLDRQGHEGLWCQMRCLAPGFPQKLSVPASAACNAAVKSVSADPQSESMTRRARGIRLQRRGPAGRHAPGACAMQLNMSSWACRT